MPGKYEMDEARATRGVMTDEWVNDEWMDMYEMGEALKGAGIDRLNTLMYHNCFMGNIESITEIKDYADYAHKLAQTTDDAEMKNISDALDQAFKAAIIDYRDISNSMQHLDHYTLSVNLIDKVNYYYDYKTNYPWLNAVCYFNEGYEKCDFHKKTNWGQWLSTNEQLLNTNPQKGCGGPLQE